MSELATWVLAGGGTFVIAAITFWMSLQSQITKATIAAEAAEKKADKAHQVADEKSNSAHMLASAAIAKHELLIRDINQDRVDIVAKIAALEAVTRQTTASLVQAETRLARSIEDMGGKIDHLSDMLIKTLSEMVARSKDKS